MRILVTGASGFIGRHLIGILDEHKLLLLDVNQADFKQKNIVYLKADLADTSSWKKQILDFAPEVCIHLAWKGLSDYSFKSCLENFNISAGLFEFLVSSGCKKIVCTGTCWEYGELQGLVKEDSHPQKLGLFASFKTGLRLLGESLCDERGVDFVWARLFFVYGPGQREMSLIPSCYSSLARGEQPSVRNPKALCDFIHVSDVASAIKSLAETDGIKGVFNVGSGVATGVSRVCGYIASSLNPKDKLYEAKDTCYVEGFWADISLIREKTGWKPRVSIQKGVEETVKELSKKQ